MTTGTTCFLPARRVSTASSPCAARPATANVQISSQRPGARKLLKSGTYRNAVSKRLVYVPRPSTSATPAVATSARTWRRAGLAPMAMATNGKATVPTYPVTSCAGKFQ